MTADPPPFVPAPLAPPPAIFRGRAGPVAGAIIAVCVLVEVALLGADLGLWGSVGWRPLAYQYGGFWAGLLQGWRPNYPGQAALMFLSHGFLHAGPGHLIGNMLALSGVVQLGMARLGARGFALLYLASMLGGGAAFELLATSPAPMVGASGAIFGLAGAWGLWSWTDRHALGLRGWAAIWPLLASALVLAGFNAASFVLQDGLLAWEAHLGGYLAGFGLAALRTRR